MNEGSGYSWQALDRGITNDASSVSDRFCYGGLECCVEYGSIQIGLRR
jgi:hypothetical protein